MSSSAMRCTRWPKSERRRAGGARTARVFAGVVAVLALAGASCSREPGQMGTPAVLEELGEVLAPAAGGSDLWSIGMGAALRRNGTVWLVYSGAEQRNERERSVRWLPHLARSEDGGRTWRRLGRILGMPPGRIMVTGESILEEGGSVYLFYHTQAEGAQFTDASGWAIGVARSADMTHWDDLGEFLRGADLGLKGALTNPSVLRVGDAYYMAVSHCLGPHRYGIRLLRGSRLLGPYQDLGFLIDPGNPQCPWYVCGAWDSELFQHGGAYYILFGGKDSPDLSGFRHYGLAVSENIEGPYRVYRQPFFSATEAQVGGRSAVFPNDDGTVTTIVDMWTAGYERVGVRAFRLRLPATAEMAAPAAARDPSVKAAEPATALRQKVEERLRGAQRRLAQMKAERDTGVRPADPFRVLAGDEWPGADRCKYELQHIVRNCLVFRASAVYEKELTPGDREVLALAVGADFPPDSDRHDSVEFRLVAVRPPAETSLFASEWESYGTGPGWREVSVDLGPFVGQAMTLRFEATVRSNASGQGAGPICLVGEPRVIGPPMPGLPNLVLCVIEAVRRDHATVYGYGRPTMPFFERLAEEAVVFEEGWAQSSSTRGSVASILTGLYPSQHGALLTLDRLDESLVTLPEILRQGGYVTAAFLTCDVIARPAFNFDQGYDLFVDEGHCHGDLLRQDLLAWLEAERPAPFFAYVHTLDPHGPYCAPGGYRDRFVADYRGRLQLWGELTPKALARVNALDSQDVEFVRARYAGEVLYADTVLERLVTGLKERGLWHDTLAIITADHGEQLGEHGAWGHWQDLYPEKLRIPLLIKLPGGRLAGTRVAGLASHVDILPTVLSAVGVPMTEGLAGLDLLPSAAAGARTPRRYHVAQFWDARMEPQPEPHCIVTSRQFALVSDEMYFTRTEWTDGRVEEKLFRRREDPDALRNVLPDCTDEADALRQVLQEHMAEPAAVPDRQPAVDEDTLEGLKSLGYL